jgi:hypothetical protein
MNDKVIISVWIGQIGVTITMFLAAIKYAVSRKNGVKEKVYDEHIKDFKKFKESVQYKDNCTEIQKKLDERHEEIKNHLTDIKDMIRANGKRQ